MWGSSERCVSGRREQRKWQRGSRVAPSVGDLAAGGGGRREQRRRGGCGQASSESGASNRIGLDRVESNWDQASGQNATSGWQLCCWQSGGAGTSQSHQLISLSSTARWLLRPLGSYRLAKTNRLASRTNGAHPKHPTLRRRPRRRHCPGALEPSTGVTTTTNEINSSLTLVIAAPPRTLS